MRRGKRFLALLLAGTMLISSESVSVLAAGQEDVLMVSETDMAEDAGMTETFETTEVVEKTDNSEMTGESGVTELTETVEETEFTEATEAVEKTESTEATEAVEKIESIEATEAVEETESAEATEAVEVTEFTGVAEVVDGNQATEQRAKPLNGYIPLPQEFNAPVVNYDESAVPQLFAGELESYYVTPNLPAIRNQNPYGTCWSFSSISLGEIDLRKNDGIAKNLSELHLAYFSYNSVTDPLGGTEGDVNGLPVNDTTGFLNTGGNLVLSMNVLANWTGMASEEDVPYGLASTVQNEGLSPSLAYDDVVHLKNAYVLNIKQNPELVKAAIKEYGAVGVSYYSEYEGYNEDNNCYYYGQYDTTNHAVTIVGWDDDFPKENFNSGCQPQSDGAWLIRNSWGEYYDGYNLNGYFWMSYEETSLASAAYVFDVTVEGQDDYYDNNYQYDGGMFSASWVSTYTGRPAANVFTVSPYSGGEVLEAVMFSATGDTNQNYKVEIYTDLTDATVPDSGTLAATETGVCAYAGIYTIELSEAISLDAGDVFSVVVTLTSADGGYGILDCEYPYSSWFETITSACAGQSYTKSGTTWTDYGATYGRNIRIKAFTNKGQPVTGVEILSGNVELSPGESATIEAKVLPSNAGNRNISWASSDETVATVDADGKVTAVNYGTATITVTTEEGGFSASITVSVTKKLISIALDKERERVEIGENTTLRVLYNPADTISDKTVVWRSSNESVATVAGSVDESGNGYAVVTAVGCGRTTITANVAGKEVSCVIEVPPQDTTVTAKTDESGAVLVSWNDVSGCTDYAIYRRAAAAQSPVLLAIIDSENISYTDTTANPGVRYYYSVETIYDDGEGDALKTLSEETYVVYRIGYVLNGGTNAQDNPVTYCESDDIMELAEPQYDLAIFEGWYLDETFTREVSAINPTELAGNITLYAKWRMRQELAENWLIYEETQVATEEGIIPEITIKNGGYTLVKDVDYTMSYVNEIIDEIRYCNVTIIGIGEYIGTLYVTIREKGIVLSEDMIGDIEPYIYTGEAIEAEPVVRYEENLLVRDKDYSITYKKNVNAGMAVVVITGMGRYEGSAEKEFRIQPKELEDNFAQPIAAQRYTGKAISPEVVLNYNGIALQKNTDYRLSCSDNVNVGTAHVEIIGCGNFTGSIQTEFTIVPEDIAVLIASGTIKVLFADGSETYETNYVGKPVEPEIMLVLDDGSKLKEGSDYQIAYENNNEPGTAGIIITGVGNYSGAYNCSFEIEEVILQDSMVAYIAPATFNGNAVEPEVAIGFMDKMLEKGVDYEVAYENNTGVGTAIVRITGKGRFCGTVEKEFKIRAKSLERAFVTVVEPGYYTGTGTEPIMVLQYNGNTLVENVDYEVTYRNNIETGSATALVKGRGNYTGTIRVGFEILPAALERLISNGAVSVLLDGVEVNYEAAYTGKAIEPEVTLVLLDGSVLESGTDYLVSYANNIIPGTADVIVSGMGNYTGTFEVNFEIKEIDIRRAEILAGKNLTVFYTATSQKPLPKVVYGDKRLIEGEDYEVVYYRLENGRRTGFALEQISDVGTYEIVLRGINDFTGETEMASVVTVKARSFSSGTIRIDNTYARYDAAQDKVTANYKLWYQSTLLREGVDYTVKDVILSEDRRMATFVFEGAGNYSGSIVWNFPVVAADIIMFSEGEYVIEKIADQYFSGERITPAVRVVKASDATVVLQKDVDYTVSYRYNLNVGVATVTVRGIGRCVGEMTDTFTIVPADIGNRTVDELETTIGGICFELDANEYVYNGSEYRPNIHVSANGKEWKAEKDYIVSYEDIDGNSVSSKNAGIYYAVVTMQGNYSGRVKFAYRIMPRSLADVEIVIPDLVYTGKTVKPTINEIQILIDGQALTAGQKDGLSVTDAQNNVNVTEKAVVTLEGVRNFSGEKQCTFTITAKSIKAPDLKITLGGVNVTGADTGYATEWTGKPQTPEVLIQNGNMSLESGKDYTLEYRYNTERGTARVLLSGKNNYRDVYVLFFEITGMRFAEESGVMVAVKEGEYYYNGEQQVPEVTVEKNGTALVEGTDYNVVYANNVNAGTAKVVVTGMGQYEGSITKTFTILPKTLEQAETVKLADIAKQRYSGGVVVPEIDLEIDGQKLVPGKDYQMTALNAIEVGTARLVVSGIGNYKGILAERTFEIYKTTITYVLNGGVNSPNNPDYYTATDKIVFAEATKEDYLFVGWYSDKACKNRVTGIEAGTDGNKTFYAKWTKQVVKGIDVSKWNGNIDWNAVKKSGVTFVIIRAGNRYGSSGVIEEDPKFAYNFKEALKAGLKVGVYFYSQAVNESEAIEEANKTLELIRRYKSEYEATTGKKGDLTYPIFIDTEYLDGGRANAISTNTRTACVKAFCQRVEAAGYKAGVYANKDWYIHNLYAGELNDYCIWVAQYPYTYTEGMKSTYTGPHRIWQYSSSGSVSGISGRVDMNICYQDYIKYN